MAIIDSYAYEPMVGDPDDHRPNTTWSLVVDPERADGGYVRGLTVLWERCAAGDRIPLHTHNIDEVIIIDDGDAEVTVGDERRRLGAGAVVFVPAGTPHGNRNAGTGVLSLHAIFGSPQIDITYIERNPAPGTEGEAPQPPSVYDARQP